MREVALRPVGLQDEQECISLAVSEDQSNFVASNSKSLEWSRKNPRCVPLAVYADHKMVGFAMYEPRGNDVFSIHRIMIDAHHQRKGIGRRALELTIDKIKNLGGITIYLSFRAENQVAEHLFQGLGFTQHEIEPDGEIVYRLGPPRDIAF
ncbi:GNAT family N-acetyltransferase [Acidobacteriota bacterium]